MQTLIIVETFVSNAEDSYSCSSPCSERARLPSGSTPFGISLSKDFRALVSPFHQKLTYPLWCGQVVLTRLICARPAAHSIRDRNFVSMSPLQFGEKVSSVHCASPRQSFSKRGSFRSGSHAGSTRRLPTVTPLGTSSKCGSAARTGSKSPKKV